MDVRLQLRDEEDQDENAGRAREMAIFCQHNVDPVKKAGKEDQAGNQTQVSSLGRGFLIYRP